MTPEDQKLSEMNKEIIGIVQRATVSTQTESEAKWTNIYFEALKADNQEAKVSTLKGAAKNLEAHLKILLKYPAFSAMKPDANLAALLVGQKWIHSDKYTPASYIEKLSRLGFDHPHINSLLIELAPKSPKECLKYYATHSKSTGLLDIELAKYDDMRKSHILAGLAIRGHEPLFHKAMKKVKPDILKEAVQILQSEGTANQAAINLVERNIPKEKNMWSEAIPPSISETLTAVNAILRLHEQYGAPLDPNTRCVLAELISKVVPKREERGISDPANVLLLRSLNLNDKDLYKHLLASGVSPNFNVPDTSQEKIASQTFGEAIVGWSLARKDPEWLQLAVEHGLKSDASQHLLHKKLINTTFSSSVSKAGIKELFSIITSIEPPDEFTATISSISSVSGFNKGMEKVLSDIYKTYYAKQVLGGENGKVKEQAPEIDLF